MAVLHRTGSQAVQMETMKSIDGSAKKLKQTGGNFKKSTNIRQRSADLASKPKDYATSVKYKDVVERDAFKTVLD